MNEILMLIGGIIAVLTATVVIAILFASVYQAYRKIRPADEGPGNQQRPALKLIVPALLVIVWGLLVGFGAGLLGHILPFVVLYLTVMALGSGKGIAVVVRHFKLRQPSQIVILSLLSALTIYGVFHYAGYLIFQMRAANEIFLQMSDIDSIRADGGNRMLAARVIVDYALKEETGHSGFIGYLLYKANQGISMGRFYSSNRINLGPILTWLYWVLQFGIILAVTIYRGKNALRMPFCEACGNWYSSEKHLGGTSPANESILLELIEQKDFTALGKLMDKNAELPSLEVYFQGCTVCGKSPSQLVVRRAAQGAKGILQFTDATKTTLQPNESMTLFNQFSFSGD
jgi:hypothetical protein